MSKFEVGQIWVDPDDVEREVIGVGKTKVFIRRLDTGEEHAWSITGYFVADWNPKPAFFQVGKRYKWESTNIIYEVLDTYERDGVLGASTWYTNSVIPSVKGYAMKGYAMLDEGDFERCTEVK